MKTEVKTTGAPAAIGPYVQAVRTGGLVFLSGQIALDPSSGELVGDGIAPQTRRVLENIKAVLEAAGTDLGRVLRTTVYLTNMGDFGAMNEVYRSVFAERPPARSTVGVASLPRGALVEIDAIAEV